MKLEVIDGSFSYNKVDILYDNVNLSVSKGEVLSILGTNGSGKTTLLKCIMNLLNFEKGASYINGKNVKQIPKLFKIISYVPQAKGVNSSLKAVDMVLLGLSPNMGLFEEPKTEDVSLAIEIMKSLGIAHLQHKRCDEISGGELQMILIARAIISKPQILILDEPESNLDFKNQLTILSKIKDLVSRTNIICIINTHYPDHAYKISDKILLINKKEKNTIFGETKNIITEENLKKIFDIDVLVKEFREHDHDFKVILPFLNN